MVFWKTQPAPVAPSATSAGMDHSEEMIAEVDEPPDERKQNTYWSPPKLNMAMRPAPLQNGPRRESLLTRQLHSETEHSDEDHLHQPPRTLSTQSTWSNQSTASTAELTSDDGHSMPSPALSPPLQPTQHYSTIPPHEKPLDKKLKIVGEEDVATSSDGKETGSEKSVEATLGRKRCIMFACRGKEEAKPKTPSPTSAPAPEKAAASSPPKRKCMIKFACPSRSTSEAKPAETTTPKRPASPPPMQRKPSGGLKPGHVKSHRGSDSTVTHGSPRSVRKSPSITTAPSPTEAQTPKPVTSRKLNDSDDTGTEAMRFHEFASSEDEPEEWVKESTCHRSRLTITDTLQKENVIRKACEEVEEEVIEDEDEVDEEAEDEVDEVEGLDDDADEDEEDEESEQSDAGFHSDDEDGFAASDSEGEDSDYEWWKPGGSTAATSVEHLDRLHIHSRTDVQGLASSVNSASSGELSPRSLKHRSPLNHRHHHHRRSTNAIPIRNRLEVEDELPDSTDFVCGTLDEDRPLEQAYINRVKKMEAAKHKARPQDIDPTFPTSDPEMDEEDDEDLEDAEESERENMVHGDMDELDGESTLRRPRMKNNRSPPPSARYHSPPPSKRHGKHHSPAPVARRTTARSPPPRKLFGQSPKRAKSPAPVRMTSPPNTRSSSPSRAVAFEKHSRGLAERPQLTHTASLPRGGGFLLSRMCRKSFDDLEGSDTTGANITEIPKRGAIDIVKGLEKKRQRRKEKMWQKMCAKAAAKGDKAYKVKPGTGCQRMREVGLQLQAYHGKGEHILSV